MIKSLFVFKKSTQSKDYEITKENQPEIFSFIEQLAEETNAPKPHKVFLSHDVNAAVFYDISLLNLIFPSKKNLIIGLGLVNALNMSEFKAVLAHEFGHFAQGSMAIGRWVGNLHMVAGQLINTRDWLDKILDFISGIDLRIAWIGWLLRIIIWSIRSFLDTVFRWVVLAERALSREMEYQADLVAVGVTGSDALIHALHKLRAADEANSEALSITEKHLNKEASVDDIFPIQSRVMEHHARVLNDADYGRSPAICDKDPKNHRLFTAEIGQPPQMWATHPQNHLRENNAKQLYIPCVIDSRSAWDAFREPQKLRADLTAYLIQRTGAQTKSKVTREKVFTDLDKRYQKEFYKSEYRGLYMKRSIVRNANSVSDLISLQLENPEQYLSTLYPESLEESLEKLINYNKEIHQLEEIRDGFYIPQDGVIRCHTGQITKNQIPSVLTELMRDRDELEKSLKVHDQLCRSVHSHLAAQAFPNSGSQAYQMGLLHTLHYAEHTNAELLDLYGLVSNTFQIIIADGNVSGRELTRLVADCHQLYTALKNAYNKTTEIVLDSNLLERLDIESWHKAIGEFKCGIPSNENIQGWLEAMDSWFYGISTPLNALGNIALELLLEEESEIRKNYHEQTPLTPRPGPSTMPSQYTTLIEGEERALQRKLNWWDSFQTATGVIPSTLRFLISCSIVVSVLFASIYYK